MVFRNEKSRKHPDNIGINSIMETQNLYLIQGVTADEHR